MHSACSMNKWSNVPEVQQAVWCVTSKIPAWKNYKWKPTKACKIIGFILSTLPWVKYWKRWQHIMDLHSTVWWNLPVPEQHWRKTISEISQVRAFANGETACREGSRLKCGACFSLTIDLSYNKRLIMAITHTQNADTGLGGGEHKDLLTTEWSRQDRLKLGRLMSLSLNPVVVLNRRSGVRGFDRWVWLEHRTEQSSGDHGVVKGSWMATKELKIETNVGTT